MPFSYKTHALVGTLQSGGCAIVKTWEHTPTGPECAAAIDGAPKLYVDFVLMAPVGDTTPGNYVAQDPSTDLYCG